MPTPETHTDLEVSSSEARVIASLLGAGLESEEERISRCGLPRSTYQDTKRRVYARGLVSDRYVPNPLVFGRPFATLALARPFAEEMGDWAHRWSKARGATVVWKGLQTLFGVFLHAGPQPEIPSLSPHAGGSESPPTENLTVDLRRPSLPVYFDFEGAWSRFVGGRELWNYPRPLAPHSGRASDGVSKGAREIARSLVHRTEPSSGSERPPHLLGPVSLPPSSRRLIARGWVGWRSFPRLQPIRLENGARLDSMVLISGEVREGHRMSELFRALVGGERSFPFLMAGDDRRIILGFLSARTPPGQERFGNPGGLLTQYLAKLSVAREPMEDVLPLVDHRYVQILED